MCDLKSTLEGLSQEALEAITISANGDDDVEDTPRINGKAWLVLQEVNKKNETEFVKKERLQWERYGVCNVKACPLESSLRCDHCPFAFYCTKAHQREDWKVHQNYCKRVIWNKVKRSHPPFTAVAGKNLAQGAELFDKRVLLACPRYPTWNELEGLHGPMIGRPSACLECSEIIVSLNHLPAYLEMKNKCRDCGWPLHANCQKGSIHKDECRILKENEIKWSPDSKNLLNCLGILRGYLLKNTKPEIWNQIMSLKDKIPGLSTHSQQFLALTHDFITTECKMKVDEEEFKDFVYILLWERVDSVTEYHKQKLFVSALCQGGNPLNPISATEAEVLSHSYANEMRALTCPRGPNTIGVASSEYGLLRMKFYTSKWIKNGAKLNLMVEGVMESTAAAARL